MVFFGEYQINFSGSGRLLLPKKVRELLKGDTFILTKGFGSCLSGYDKDDWGFRTTEASATIIFGEGSVRCMYGENLSALTTIECFTIQDGHSSGSDPDNGGGLYPVA